MYPTKTSYGSDTHIVGVYEDSFFLKEGIMIHIFFALEKNHQTKNFLCLATMLCNEIALVLWLKSKSYGDANNA